MRHQGKAHISLVNGDLTVLLPDGEVLLATDTVHASEIVRRWAKADVRKHITSGAVTIEWHDGLRPPVINAGS